MARRWHQAFRGLHCGATLSHSCRGDGRNTWLSTSILPLNFGIARALLAWAGTEQRRPRRVHLGEPL
eukprot:6173570-Pleurochrysis_carterae.AAC.1